MHSKTTSTSKLSLLSFFKETSTVCTVLWTLYLHLTTNELIIDRSFHISFIVRLGSIPTDSIFIYKNGEKVERSNLQEVLVFLLVQIVER